MLLRVKDRSEIQNLHKIQDTYDMMEGNNITDTMITDSLLPIKKERWKDIAELNSETEKDGKD